MGIQSRKHTHIHRNRDEHTWRPSRSSELLLLMLYKHRTSARRHSCKYGHCSASCVQYAHHVMTHLRVQKYTNAHAVVVFSSEVCISDRRRFSRIRNEVELVFFPSIEFTPMDSNTADENKWHSCELDLEITTWHHLTVTHKLSAA